MKILKIISDILPVPSYAVIIICFFLPFLTVKCGEMELLSVSGFEMAKGVDFEEKMKDSDIAKSLGKDFSAFGKNDTEESDYDTDFSDEDDATNKEEVKEVKNSKEETATKKSEPSILLILPFILAIIGFCISFIKIKSKSIIHIMLSGLIFLSLLVFGILLKNNKELGMLDSFDNGASGFGLKEGMIKVSLGGAFYISCIISLLVISYFGLESYLKKQVIKPEQNTLKAIYDDFNASSEEENIE